jgi:LPS-assembly protein
MVPLMPPLHAHFCLIPLLVATTLQVAYAETSSPPLCPAPSALRQAKATTIEASAPPITANPNEPIEVLSDGATLDLDGDASLKGDVDLRQGERRLRAEDVDYDAKTRRFSINGAIRYSDGTLEAAGQAGSYQPADGAIIENGSFALPARPARGAADAIRIGLDGKVSLSDVWFSTCPEAKPGALPDWRIKASDITLDTAARAGSGRNASIEFLGVPILYLPYLSFPLGDQRKSGFLFPNLGYNTRGGVEIAVPYYLNLAPNYDLTLVPTLYGRRGLDVDSRFRYLTRQHRGELRLNYLPSDSIRRIDRSWLQAKHRSDFGDRWRLDVNAQSVSDAEYFEDFAAGAEGTSTAFLQRIAQLSYSDDRWHFRGEFQQFQTIDRQLDVSELPYAQLPRLSLGGAGLSKNSNLPLAWSLDSELVNFDRDVGVTGWRLDIAPRIGLDWSGPGYYLQPSAGWRFTRYELDDVSEDDSSSPSRSLPFAAIDAGFILERKAKTADDNRITLEPRLLYLWTPWRDQTDLPIFDTAIPDLDFVQLFRTERYVGADRVSDANQVSLGTTARIYDGKNGRQKLAATIGQTFYFDTPRIRLPNEPLTGRNESDLFAQVSVAAWRSWNVNMGLQWNSLDSRQERSQVRLQYRPDAERALNFAYRYQHERLEQGEVSGAWPVSRRWNAFGRMVYDLQDRASLETFAGAEYKACCWRLRLVGRRFVSTRTGERDTGIYLQLELNGLASVGSSADAFLEQAIRGYSSTGVTR